MTIAEFRLLSHEHIDGALLALWWDGKDNWERAHNVAQDIHNADGSWVHAYLHRKEGDLGNAAYWYTRAGRPVAVGDLEAEWESLVRHLLARRG